ncbi:LLM class flavin-dependent oxidoreductase [Actinokineospora bangkokensis]|uniref:LLM class flavin-dependent oxidoreductase n=1 Tax=Actinokineospora bangkokensis TaxID=1193682 RepID=UPI001E3FA53C|nr:LLM class flavin-dependent oxidoreductase [Actinokineospora bangkokensis]
MAETARSIGLVVPRDLPAAQVLPFARRAEELGFDELWVVEDLGFRGGVAQASAVLAVTSRIRVGVGILPAGARNAAFAAMELATLAQLFPGRVTAGIGHGMPDWMRQVGAWRRSPLTLLGEHTAAVRALLRGEPGPAAGEYVDVEGVVLDELPEVVPPVVLGVRGPRSLELAGRVADGILLAEPATPPYVERSRGHAGPVEHVVTYDVAVVADSAADAVAAVRPALAAVGEPAWAPHLRPLPFADELREFRRSCAGSDEFATTMPAAWVAELSLAGTAEQVRDRVAARFAAGATSVVLVPHGADALPDLARVL